MTLHTPLRVGMVEGQICIIDKGGRIRAMCLDEATAAAIVERCNGAEPELKYNDDECYGVQPLPLCDVGDKVKAVPPSTLHCGSGCYEYAIVIDVNEKREPIALASPLGDMLWTKTINHIRLKKIGKAHWRELCAALRRYSNEAGGKR
jgi:hypothetical protein